MTCTSSTLIFTIILSLAIIAQVKAFNNTFDPSKPFVAQQYYSTSDCSGTPVNIDLVQVGACAGTGYNISIHFDYIGSVVNTFACTRSDTCQGNCVNVPTTFNHCTQSHQDNQYYFTTFYPAFPGNLAKTATIIVQYTGTQCAGDVNMIELDSDPCYASCFSFGKFQTVQMFCTLDSFLSSFGQ